MLKALARLRECCRQAQAGVVSNSKNKIHQTWQEPFSRALYFWCDISNQGADASSRACETRFRMEPLFARLHKEVGVV